MSDNNRDDERPENVDDPRKKGPERSQGRSNPGRGERPSDKPGGNPRSNSRDGARGAYGRGANERGGRDSGTNNRSGRTERESSGRPPYGDRNSRPQRSGAERPGYGERPARPYGSRTGDAQRPPRGEGPRSGERRPYGDRSQRPQGERPSYGDRPQRPQGDRPAYGDRPQRPQGDRPSYRDRPQGSDSGRDRGERPKFGDRGGRPDRAGAPRGDSSRGRFDEVPLTEEQRIARELRMVRPHHDDPIIDADVTEDQLDKVARNELKTLTKENAEVVAKHLVMAVRLIDENPELAHQHVLSAARRAGRIAIVRETLGITAYSIGDFALALRELRTFRRISGSNEQIALMVDSERGVGRPDRALELGRSVDRTTLSDATQVALAIAMSGARLDQDQVQLALAELEIPQLDPTKAFTYSPALFRAYADVLLELGRGVEAADWVQCAEVAESALVQANLLAATAPADDDDMIVIEEDWDEGLEVADSVSVEDSSPAAAAPEVEDFLDPADLLEPEVRAILEETAHLDSASDGGSHN
jgi:23S rRNA pseudouridine2605 synthase